MTKHSFECFLYSDRRCEIITRIYDKSIIINNEGQKIKAFFC